MIPEQNMYAITAAVMAAVAVVFGLAVSRLPAAKRRYYLPVVAVPAVTATTFAAMSQGVLLIERADGRRVPVGRLLAYLVIYPITMGYIGWAAGLDRRKAGTLAVGIAVVVGGVSLNWLFPAYSSVGSLAVLGALLGVGYLLAGPYDRLAADRPGECSLLYGKLRNLLLMLWVLYVLLSMVSRQQLGLLDVFAGVLFGNYLDLLAVVGFGAIVLRSRAAMTILIDEVERSGGFWPDEESVE